MWRFCNDNRRLLRKNVRTAPVIPMDDLKKKFAMYRDWNNSKGEYFPWLELRSVFFQNNKKANADRSEVQSELENYVLKDWIILNNGVPIALFIEREEEWSSLARYHTCCCSYWDGEDLRIYIPRYGNYYNAYTNTSFGIDCENYDLYDLEDPYRIFMEDFLKKEIIKSGKTENKVISDLGFENKDDFLACMDDDDEIFYFWKYGNVPIKDLLTNCGHHSTKEEKEAKIAILEDINLAIQVI